MVTDPRHDDVISTIYNFSVYEGKKITFGEIKLVGRENEGGNKGECSTRK